MDPLALYITVVEQGSFNKAAEVLKITQPTVSKQIDRLEDRLGVRLFKRSTRKLILTSAGERYYQRAKEASEFITNAEREIRHLAEEEESILRISSSLSSASILMPPVIRALSDRHPQAKFRLYTASGASYYHEHYELEYDLFIYEGEPADSSLVSRKLGDIPMGFYASPDYLARVNDSSLTSLPDTHYHFLTTRNPKASNWEKKLLPHFDPSNLEVRLVGSTEQVTAAFAEAGLGVICAPEHQVRTALERGTLQPLDLHEKAHPVPLHAVYRKEYLSPLARECLDLLSEHIGQLYPNS